MYGLNTPLTRVKGIGAAISQALADSNIHTVGDFLLAVPLRYEDRSNLLTIEQLAETEPEGLPTIQATIKSISNRYRGRRSVQSAKISDDTGNLNITWFNNPHIAKSLQKGQSYLFSGTYNPKYHSLTQPKVEKVAGESIHTNRLVPVYSQTLYDKQGTLRRLLKNILDHLAVNEFTLPVNKNKHLPNLVQAFTQIHFPDDAQQAIAARERLAIEEFLFLMQVSASIKKEWKDSATAIALTVNEAVPKSVPFILTQAQKKCWEEIAQDLAKITPMNRLLIGDVGSGKTVVAGLALRQAVLGGLSAALIAPTTILAQQHYETIKKLFPDIPLALLTSHMTKDADDATHKLYIGTHSVINQLERINPAVIVFDEQHRFGVSQRSTALELKNQPHILTMTATPIPRSLMLTLFSHLQVSQINELPPGRILSTTWLLPEKKRAPSLDWLAQKLQANPSDIAIIVCPFINPSKHPSFSQVASVKKVLPELQEYYQDHDNEISNNITIAALHGQMSKKEQQEVIDELYERKIRILVTTPVVEVGVDLPTASYMIIENAERFGLASLHQLRGRVGRAGQESYCLLFSKNTSTDIKDRLKAFCEIQDGMKLAELDLKRRGAGELYGTEQSGFADLRFGSWTNLELIADARAIFEELPANWQSPLQRQFTTQKTEVLIGAN